MSDQIVTEALTNYRVRLPANDVEAAKRKAREESVRLGQDISWCRLLRTALRAVADGRLPVN